MKNKEIAVYPFLLGLICIWHQDNKVTKIEFIKNKEEITKIEKSKDRNRSAFSDMVFSQIEEYLSGEREQFEFLYELKGTAFQKKVWKALEEIPYGETRSYKEVAIQVGNPKAQRAVGMANNRNPIPIVVPCHRVIGSNGKLMGYAGGVRIKEKLLEIEAKNKK